MRVLSLFVLLVSSIIAQGQTLELEKKAQNELLASKKRPATTVAQLVKDWNAFVKENPYPELPVDDSGKVLYSEVLELEGMNKKEIFKKAKEWLALNYGDINAVLHYEDLERGKIIAKGFFETSVKMDVAALFGGTKEGSGVFDVYHTLVFTVKDGKLKLEMKNLEYKFESVYTDFSYAYIYKESQLYPVSINEKIVFMAEQ